MKAIIKSIEIQNFKGFARASKTFEHGENVLAAENGAGKSTFRYAFLWVLGFDVPDVIPTIDNKEIPDLEINVEMKMEIDGYDYMFKRVQKEIWRTNKETGERNKEGNKSLFWLDGIPYEGSQRAYKEKVAEIFGAAYDKLEILINKDYFNSDSLNWKDRRRILFDICNVDKILNSLADKPEYNIIATDIHKGYETIKIKQAISKERLGCKAMQEQNDVVIRDKQSELAKYSSFDFDALEAQKVALQGKIDRLQTQSRRENKNELLEAKNAELSKVITELSKAQIAEGNRRNAKEKELLDLSAKLSRIKTDGNIIKSDILSMETQVVFLEQKIAELQAKEYDGDTICPMCQQALPAERIEKARAEFEAHKAREISKYKEEIDRYKSEITVKSQKVDQLRTQYLELQNAYNEHKTETENMAEDKLIAELMAKKEKLQNEIQNSKASEVKTETENKVKELQVELEGVISKLSYRNIIQDIKSKIQLLRDENKDIADRIAFLDRKEAQLAAYVLEQVSLVNETINSKFGGGVSFALFKGLYKGGEGGMEEDCTCMFNGKRYSSMSTGERYYADLEVVKALQREYGVNLPIFCDNAESVTIDTNADNQLIKLYAQKGKKLDGVTPITAIL